DEDDDRLVWVVDLRALGRHQAIEDVQLRPMGTGIIHWHFDQSSSLPIVLQNDWIYGKETNRLQTSQGDWPVVIERPGYSTALSRARKSLRQPHPQILHARHRYPTLESNYVDEASSILCFQ